MSINKNYFDKFIKTTEKAAIGAFPFIGKGDKNAADQGSVDMMRKELNSIDMSGEVVIGEGEMDEAPMLYIGEKVGTKKGQELDIALDPLEGTNFVAKNLPNSFSMLAVSEKGNLFSAPDTYMEKIAIGQNLPKNLLDLDNDVEKNIKLLSEAKKKKINEITACILNRPRHDNIIKKLTNLNVKIKFITDGDVSGAISVVDPNSNIDIYLGVGGGPEGVLAAAALSCMGGQIQTRLVLNSDETTPESSTPTDSSGSSRFIAGRVNLDTPANAIKVSVTAYKPKGTDFQVYMKYLPEGKNNFDEQKWNLLDVQPNTNPTIPNKGEFYEFEYLPPDGKFESKFKQFATKIVMVGEAASGTVADAPETPIIKDMKAVVYSKSTL